MNVIVLLPSIDSTDILNADSSVFPLSVSFIQIKVSYMFLLKNIF